MKKLILIFLFFISAAAPLMASEGYSRKDWRVEERSGSVFYLTNGTVVDSLEFGFFKDPGGCEDDVFWITFSSSNEGVKNFQGQGVVVLLHVDGKDFTLRPVMESVGKMDSTYVMMFTGWVPSEAVIKALNKGRSVKVKIADPPTFEALLDIKEEKFSLMGFKATRRKAGKMCKTILSDSDPTKE